jgi:hypothetical protein
LASTTALVDGDTYYATQTVGGCESATTAVTVTIGTPAPAATDQTLCSGTVADLQPSGTGIQWYASATGGTPLASTTALVDGDTYYATQTVGGCESPTTAVTVTIGSPSAPIIGTITQPTCPTPTGSVELSGLPSGNWTINPGNVTGNTATTTITVLGVGTYNFSL